MTFTLAPISVKDKDSASKAMIAFTDGTNNAFASGQLDATGALISPATAGNQAAANASLATIATNTTGGATAAAQATGNSSLAAIQTAVGNIPASPATAALQTTGNTTLAAIATSVAAATPAGANLIGKVGIDQTTPGTTNGVAVVSALPAGANALGTVGVTALPALPAGTNAIGAVEQVGKGVQVTATPTVTAGAYTTGQVVGGLISLAGAARVNSGSGLIQTVMVNVATTLTAPFDVVFLNTLPTTTLTDNAAFPTLTQAERNTICGVAHCNDLVALGTPQLLQAANVGIEFKLSAAATTLYAVIVLRGGQSFASTSAVGLAVAILQD